MLENAEQRGEKAERRAAEIFKSVGWIGGRLRKGPIDVIAAKEGRILLIQVKSGRARVKKKELDLMIDG